MQIHGGIDEVLIRRYLLREDDDLARKRMGISKANRDRLEKRAFESRAGRPGLQLRFEPSPEDEQKAALLRDHFHLRHVRLAPLRSFADSSDPEYPENLHKLASEQREGLDRLARQVTGMVAAGYIEEVLEQRNASGGGPFCIAVGGGKAAAEAIAAIRLRQELRDADAVDIWGMDALEAGRFAPYTSTALVPMLCAQLGLPPSKGETFAHIPTSPDSPLGKELRRSRDDLAHRIKSGLQEVPGIVLLGIGAPDSEASVVKDRLPRLVAEEAQSELEPFVADCHYTLICADGSTPASPIQGDDLTLISFEELCRLSRKPKAGAEWTVHSLAVASGAFDAAKRVAVLAALRMRRRRPEGYAPFNVLIIDSVLADWIVHQLVVSGEMQAPTVRSPEYDRQIGAAIRRFVRRDTLTEIGAELQFSTTGRVRKLTDQTVSLGHGALAGLRFDRRTLWNVLTRAIIERAFDLKQVCIAPLPEWFDASAYEAKIADLERLRGRHAGSGQSTLKAEVAALDRIVRLQTAQMAADFLTSRLSTVSQSTPEPHPFGVGLGAGRMMAAMVEAVATDRKVPVNVHCYGFDCLPGPTASETSVAIAAKLAAELDLPRDSAQAFTYLGEGHGPLHEAFACTRDALAKDIEDHLRLAFMGIGAPAAASSSLRDRVFYLLGPRINLADIPADCHYRFVRADGSCLEVWYEAPDGKEALYDGDVYTLVKCDDLAAWSRLWREPQLPPDSHEPLDSAAVAAGYEKRTAIFAACRMRPSRPFNILITSAPDAAWLLRRIIKEWYGKQGWVPEEAQDVIELFEDYGLVADDIRAELVGLGAGGAGS